MMRNKIIEIGLNKGYRIEYPEDWYQGISSKELFDCGLDYYRKKFNSLNDIIRALFPDYNFLEWKFRSVKNNWWSNIENVKSYLIWLEKELNWEFVYDWHKLSYKILEDNHGITLIKKHKCNITQIPKLLYPNYDFNEWKFKGYSVDWNNDFYVIKFLKVFESDIKILDPSDWYNISKRDIINKGGIGCVKNREMIDIVKILYPNYDWDLDMFKKSTISKAQRFIIKHIKAKFPNNKIIINDRKTIHNPYTNHYLELDIYLPELSLAIEYDGKQHFQIIESRGGKEEYDKIQMRDFIKNEVCKELNIKLLRIHYLEKNIKEFIDNNLYIYYNNG